MNSERRTASEGWVVMPGRSGRGATRLGRVAGVVCAVTGDFSGKLCAHPGANPIRKTRQMSCGAKRVMRVLPRRLMVRDDDVCLRLNDDGADEAGFNEFGFGVEVVPSGE